MDDKKGMIENFGDMVNATERMSNPWKDTVWKLLKALVLTNLFWAVIVGLLVWFAYMAPDTSYQTQDFDGQLQTQSVGSEVVTNGS